MEKIKVIEDFIFNKVVSQCNLLGIEIPKLGKDLDLVKEGIFDSLTFIDLIAECESEFGIIIELEKYNPSEFTRFKKLSEIIELTLRST